MNKCELVRDLLPLYVEGLTSKETNEYIQKHLEECPECRKMLKNMCVEIERDDERQNVDYNKLLGTQKRQLRKKIVIYSLVGMLAGIYIGLMYLYLTGALRMLDQQTSPDGTKTVTIYRANTVGLFFTNGGDFEMEISDEEGFDYVSSFSAEKYEGVSWSPNSNYMVLSLLQSSNPEMASPAQMLLVDFQNQDVKVLSALLATAQYKDVEQTPETRNGNAFWDTKYQLLCWDDIGESMLVRYHYETWEGVNHMGYFWYNYQEESISGMVEYRWDRIQILK